MVKCEFEKMISKEWNDGSPANMRKLSSCNGSSSAGSWRSQDSGSSKTKEFSRPPVYNAEDYAASLKKWTGKASTKNVDQDVTAQFPSSEGEMSLRQFLSVSDLLEKLRTDLRLAYLSFVQEFVSDPIDGTTLILELLRSIQQNDTQQQVKVTPAMHRRALLDENSCLQCLKHCLRCEETTRRLAMSSAGLFTLAVCIMSSVSKSRIISLELLSEICRNSTISGHNAVSEALSTMRLRFGEPVRFRFLVSMLNGASSDLLIAGLQFINTFLETSPSKQTRLYVQAELEQAGLNSETFKKILSVKDRLDELVLKEYNRWSSLYIDVEMMNNNLDNKCKEVSVLRDQIAQLEIQIRILQDEKETISAREKSYKERFKDLEYRLTAASRAQSAAKKSHHNAIVVLAGKRDCGGNSTPAEDEGISSSDQDDSEELVHSTHAEFVSHDDRFAPPSPSSSNNSSSQNGSDNRPPTLTLSRSKFVLDKTPEPTIDEVMEDFQNIINDVQSRNYRNESRPNSRVAAPCTTSYESLHPEALILDKENDIVPTKILPEPPKKSRSLHLLNKNIERNPFFEDESGGENSHCSGCSSERYGYRRSSPDKMTTYGRYAYDMLENTRMAPHSAVMPPAKIHRGSAANRTNLLRSETFHHLQMVDHAAVAMAPPPTFHRMVPKGKMTADKTIFSKSQTDLSGKGHKNRARSQPNYDREREPFESCAAFVLSRSISTKPLNGNAIKRTKNVTSASVPFPKLNPISYFSRTNLFPTNGQQLKSHTNAGLYSGKSQHSPSGNNNHLHQVITITSEYPKRSLNGLKQINLNVGDGKIMDLPSGLY